MATNPDPFLANVNWNPGYGPTPAPTAQPTPNMPPAMAESIARSQGKTTLPNPTGITPQQFMNPVPMATPTPPSPQVTQQAFQVAKDSGVLPPQTAGEAASAVQTFTKQAASAPSFYKPDPNSPQVVNAKGEKLSYDQFISQGGKADFSNVQAGGPPAPNATPLQGIEAQLTQDKGYQQLLKDYADYSNIANQSKSLLDNYNQIVKSSGLDAINTELINTQKIIDGTEQDIRNEVTAASGFATNSQVLALASARNKTLIQNYNALVAQQKNITDQVNTMMNLSTQDRTFAIDSIKNKLQIDQQLNDYAQKFTANAQEAYKNIISAVGYKGLYNSLANDPHSISLAEQTLGLASGGLQQLASQTSAITSKDTQIVSVGGHQKLVNTVTGETIKDLGPTSKTGSGNPPTLQEDVTSMANELDSVTGVDGYISPEDWRTARNAWVKAGRSATSFTTNFRNYINPADPQDYK